MQVDAITLAAVADEWRTLLIGARIDTIIAPTEYAIALQCYAPGKGDEGGRNRWVYLSAHPQLARAHISALKPPKIVQEPSAFVMLLRKYLEGTRVEAIEQPRWERVVELIASYRNRESGEQAHFRLIIEIMGRLSNIILCDERGIILGSLKRVGEEINRYRSIAPNLPYVPPPPQHRTIAGESLPKLEPGTITGERLALCAAEDLAEVEPAVAPRKTHKVAVQKKNWQILTKNLIGFGPLLAREAVYRATQNAESLLDTRLDEWEKIAEKVRDLAKLYDTARWTPQLVERVETESGQNIPIAFAPYMLEQYIHMPDIEVRESPSMNVILDEYYARTEWRDAMDSVRTPLRKLLQTQRDRCKRKADLLRQELLALDEAARYRLSAELLLAGQHDVQQGQQSVSLSNFYEQDSEGNAPVVTIPLDPRFDGVGNANRLFNKYHKLRRAAALIPAQIEQNAVELATIEQLLADLMLAETPAEVGLVRAEVQTAGYIRGAARMPEKKAQKAQKSAKKHKGKGGKPVKGKPNPPGGGVPLHVQSRDGFVILIGKNSRQNEEVTFHQATANDMWLHARGVPGSHVIIKAAGGDIPRSTIEQAASLAAYYSQARESTSVPIDYTLQRHIRHMKGGGPGMVLYERERTIQAKPLPLS